MLIERAHNHLMPMHVRNVIQTQIREVSYNTLVGRHIIENKVN